MGKIKGWKKTEDTRNKELWVSEIDKDKLVSVYKTVSPRWGTNWTFFGRLSEPRYVDDDEYGVNVFTEEFKNRDDARKMAVDFMKKYQPTDEELKNTVVVKLSSKNTDSMNESELDKEILKYDTNDVDYALQDLGFPTDYEYFVDELEGYTKEDKQSLLQQLRDNEE